MPEVKFININKAANKYRCNIKFEIRMKESKLTKCCFALAQKNLKIAFAESATCGALAASFALTPNSGDILLGSIVCYDADEKTNILQIPKRVIEEYTPESSEVTALMATGAKRLFEKADIIVAVTGLIKKGGSEKVGKPVGTMFIHFIFPDYEYRLKEVFHGNPIRIIRQSILKIADIVTEQIAEI